MLKRNLFFMFAVALLAAVVLCGCSFGAGGFKLGLQDEQKL